MNSFRGSDGIFIKKSVIDTRVKRAKKEKLERQKDEYDYNFCENPVCGRSGGVYLDCAHVISVNDCQNSGKAELAYCIDNIKILCRACHKVHDGIY